jgi:hypothetical protein
MGEKYSLLKRELLVLCICMVSVAYSQVNPPEDDLKADSLGPKGKKIIPPAYDLSKQYDFGDLVRQVLHPRQEAGPVNSGSGISVIPNINANPTIGFQVGIKAVGGKKLGGDPNTLMSVGATSASITTKGIIFFYISHNIFTPGNDWNLQGSIIAAKAVAPDRGLGIGSGKDKGDEADKVLANPAHKAYVIHSQFYNFREKVYKEVQDHLFVGAGLSFDIRRKMENNDSSGFATPSGVYNNRHGFPADRYSANGFLFNVQYITRDNPNRPYKGLYFDVGLRVNQTWIGSTKNSVQCTTDFRKYFSLSEVSPETVLAFWNWGSYLLSGAIPYLELPGTGRDGNSRSGRGYTVQYFKGTQFNDTETEFRFPILKNNFISGVAFFNLQTANDEQGTKLFQVFQPGYGAGLRVLFNKAIRTNLALDYAFGKFGSKGFFLNLNEAF